MYTRGGRDDDHERGANRFGAVSGSPLPAIVPSPLELAQPLPGSAGGTPGPRQGGLRSPRRLRSSRLPVLGQVLRLPSNWKRSDGLVPVVQAGGLGGSEADM